jgi:hypothetical protein
VRRSRASITRCRSSSGGSSGRLDRFAGVYVECLFVPPYAEQVLAYLRDQGFRLNGVYNLTHDRSGGAVQADFQCERQ